MGTTISATEAVRHFSELLNSIKYRGDQFTIIRGGKPAAALVPVESTVPEKKLGRLKAIFKTLPQLDRRDETFSDDVMAGVSSQPALPGKTGWD